MSATTRSVAEKGAIEEELFCWRAHLRGLTYDQIAPLASAHFGKTLSRATVHRRVAAERKRLTDELRSNAEEDRATHTALLKGLIAEQTEQAARCRQAIARAAELKAFDVHAEKLLAGALVTLARLDAELRKIDGSDSPVRSEVTVTVKDAHDLAMEELASEMDARAVTS